jgi:DNA-binding CsgD family transcriptional regulator
MAAEGSTNAEISSRLQISRRTVESNLARTYRKLGIRGRAQLSAALAARSER